MPTYFNRGATYSEDPGLPTDPLIDSLAQTNAKVEQFELSPSGLHIAYVSAESGGFDLWVCGIDGSNNRRLVVMYPEECLGPSWSPDGEWVGYTARGEAFKVRADGSEPPINLSYGYGPTGGHEYFKWTPDGKRVLFIHTGPNGFNQVASLSTEIPTGKVKLQYLTDEEFNSTDVEISPDGKWVTFMSDRSGYGDFKRMDAWIVSIDGGKARNMTPDTFEYYDYRPRWSSDGKKLVFTSDRSNFRKVGTIDIGTGLTSFITGDGRNDEYNPRWSPDGEWIAYVVNINWAIQIFKVKADGSEPPIQLTKEDGIHGGIDAYQARGTIRWTPDSKNIVFTYMDHRLTSDIWVIPANGGDKKQITDHMPSELKGFSFVKPDLIEYVSNDGLEIPAFLYRPNDIGDEKTPLVIYARANTKGLHVRGFYPYIQYWVHLGYTVIAPQVRGSAGLGKQYEFLNYGDWGGGDIDDFAYGAYYLAEKGLIDLNKVVMQGGSTGGYFVLAMTFRYPDLLSAAVCFYGPPDLVDMYHISPGAGLPDAVDVVGGDRGGPDMAPEHWHGRSPIYNLDKIKTPTLLLWGDRDGVRPSHADDYYRVAKDQGLNMEYVLYNCEPHGWYHWRPEDLGDSIKRIARHFWKAIES